MRRVGWLYLSLADRVGTGRTTEALRMPVHSHAAQVMAMSYLMLATTTDPAGCRWLLHTLGLMMHSFIGDNKVMNKGS
jgi:hypothetical protein